MFTSENTFSPGSVVYSLGLQCIFVKRYIFYSPNMTPCLVLQLQYLETWSLRKNGSNENLDSSRQETSSRRFCEIYSV